jgi:cytochrome b subunit of formate dehydrogenase
LPFWGVIGATALITVPGYMLIFPFDLTNIARTLIAKIVHSLGATLFITTIIAHTYIASIGNRGWLRCHGAAALRQDNYKLSQRRRPGAMRRRSTRTGALSPPRYCAR